MSATYGCDQKNHFSLYTRVLIQLVLAWAIVALAIVVENDIYVASAWSVRHSRLIKHTQKELA